MARWIENPTGLRFINPYNFVSLGSDVHRFQPSNGELTGKISVRLIVKTPLAIPDTENVTTGTDEHKTFPFFRVDGKPVIPGSQLRGMIRSTYETLSNSCFSVNNNNTLSARHTNPAKPGLICFKDGEWHLYEAKSKKDYGCTIDTSTEVRRNWYTINGKEIKTKIFYTTGKEVECVNIEDAIKDYQENIQIYDSNGSTFSRKKTNLTFGLSKEGLNPVFYETVEYEGDIYVYLSASQMGRYVFGKKLDDLLDTHASCAKQKAENESKEKQELKLCKACSLFGMISETGQKAYASRLRFSDAQMISYNSLGNIMLKELASPKTTSVEFYSKRPNGALYWTYDYKITSYKREAVDTDKNGKRQTQIVPQKEKCDVIIRGRKYYLHNPKLKPSDYTATERTKRNSTMELCDKESQFVFDIFFEKITEQQLHELIWAITIGENDENGMQMHKLGHGRPLGLGSVKLVVEDIQIRSFDIESLTYVVIHKEQNVIDSYVSSNPFVLEDMSKGDKKAFEEYVRLTNFYGFDKAMEEKKADISYPIADDGKGTKNSKASHQWFIANRSMGENGTPTAWSVKYTLPVATSTNPTLPASLRVYDDSRNQSGHRNSYNRQGKPKNNKR